MSTVPVEGLANEIMKNLTEYSQEVTDGIKKAEDETAKECRDNLKQDSPKKSGFYAGSWRVTVAYERTMEKRTVIHNKEYRLTHLLENGHAKRNGGRTKAYPHIKKNQEKANADFERRVREVLENGH